MSFPGPDGPDAYTELLELLPDAVFIHIGGRIVFANAMGARLLGAARPTDLLEYGRPAVADRAPAPLEPLIRECVEWCRPLAERNRITIGHHSPVGGSVTVEVNADRGRVECAIRDTGPGFAPEDLEKAFEPFYARRRGGTGLGLAIASRTVRERGGTIATANAAEGEAVVTVCLPVPGHPCPREKPA